LGPSVGSPGATDPSLRRFVLPGLFVLALFVTLWARRPEPTTTPAPPPQWDLSGAIFGTTWSVKAIPLEDGSTGGQRELQSAIEDLLRTIDEGLSTYKPASELSQLNSNSSPGTSTVSAQLGALLAESERIHGLTEGAFDITVGPLVNAWGFGPAQAVAPTPEARAEALARTGAQHLSYDPETFSLKRSIPGLYIDLSGIAKGYAVDRVAALIEAAGTDHYLVEIGGEVRTRGSKPSGQPWAVGIETPDGGVQDSTRVVPLSGRALATSGNYRNLRAVDGRTVTHIIDPRSGEPVEHGLGSVSVIADNCTEADALATALYVLGWDEGFALAERERIAALFLRTLSPEDEGPTVTEERPTSTFPAPSSSASPPTKGAASEVAP